MGTNSLSTTKEIAAACIHSLDCMHMNKCLCACAVGTCHDYNGRGKGFEWRLVLGNLGTNTVSESERGGPCMENWVTCTAYICECVIRNVISQKRRIGRSLELPWIMFHCLPLLY